MCTQPFVAAPFAPVALRVFDLSPSYILSILVDSLQVFPDEKALYVPFVLPAIRMLGSEVIADQKYAHYFLTMFCHGPARDSNIAEFLRFCGVAMETQGQSQQAYSDAVVRVGGLITISGRNLLGLAPAGLAHALVRLMNGAPPRLLASCKLILRLLEPTLMAVAALNAFRREAFMPLLLQDGTPTSPVECAICLASDTCQRVVLPCFHSYHAECFGEYLSTGATACPYCRLSVCFLSLM